MEINSLRQMLGLVFIFLSIAVIVLNILTIKFKRIFVFHGLYAWYALYLQRKGKNLPTRQEESPRAFKFGVYTSFIACIFLFLIGILMIFT